VEPFWRKLNPKQGNDKKEKRGQMKYRTLNYQLKQNWIQYQPTGKGAKPTRISAKPQRKA